MSRRPDYALRRESRGSAAPGHWLTGLRTIYRDRIAAIDANITEIWGRLNVAQQLPVVDGLLAATALVRDWTLVTRNTADFAQCGVRLLNPWDGAAAR